MEEPASDKAARKSPKKRRIPRKVTAKSLENAALHYLQRFATTAAHLRRVLMRRVDKSAYHHGTDRDEGAALIDALVARYVAAGLLDDAAFAAARALSLHGRGASARQIRLRLRDKGVDGELIDRALENLAAEHADPELSAAAALARRRRLGPYRLAEKRAEFQTRDLAALARAGFRYDMARRVIDASSTDELEAEIAELDAEFRET